MPKFIDLFDSIYHTDATTASRQTATNGFAIFKMAASSSSTLPPGGQASSSAVPTYPVTIHEIKTFGKYKIPVVNCPGCNQKSAENRCPMFPYLEYGQSQKDKYWHFICKEHKLYSSNLLVSNTTTGAGDSINVFNIQVVNTSRFEYWDSKAITWRLAKGGGKENFNLGVVCQLNTAHTCMPNKRSVIDERFKKLFKSFKCRKGHPVYVIFPNGDAEKITEDLKSYISSKFEDLREKKPAKSPEEIYKELSEAFIKQYHADKEQLQPASPPQGGMQRRRGRKILMLA